MKFWKWEIAACILSLAIPMIMVATVLPHQNQPLPKWPFKITINALLSVYNLIFKSAVAFVATSCVGQLQWAWFTSGSRPLSDAVLYNSASYGPWGLVILLQTHRFRQPLITIGAVIAISSLAIDPFTQQIIHPFDCNAPSNHLDAILPRTSRIDARGNFNGSLASVLSLGLSSSADKVPSECSTGNCTFYDTYSTLGMCSSCKDISDRIVAHDVSGFDTKMGCGFPTLVSNLSAGNDSYYWDSYEHQTSVNFWDDCRSSSFGGETELARMDTWWHPQPEGISSDEHLDQSLRIDTLVGKTTFSDSRISPSDGQNISGCDLAGGSGTWACRGYGAATCALRACVRTFSATIDTGHLTERLISESPDTRWGNVGHYYGLVDTQCISDQERRFMTEVWGYEINDTVRWIPFDGNFSELGSYSPLTDEQTLRSSDLLWSDNLHSLLNHTCLYLMDKSFLETVFYGTQDGASNARSRGRSKFVGTLLGFWESHILDGVPGDNDIINTSKDRKCYSMHIITANRICIT